jgi:hypothetical protein
MAKVPLDLIPQDFRRGHRNSTRSCMIERAMERVYGGQWIVGNDVRERGVAWPRILQTGEDAYAIMALFDSHASMQEIFHGRPTVRIYLRGKPLQPQSRRKQAAARRRQAPGRQLRTTALISAVASVLLIADGLLWAVITAAVMVAAAFAGVRIRNTRRQARTGAPAPQPAWSTGHAGQRAPEPGWHAEDGPVRYSGATARAGSGEPGYAGPEPALDRDPEYAGPEPAWPAEPAAGRHSAEWSPAGRLRAWITAQHASPAWHPEPGYASPEPAWAPGPEPGYSEPGPDQDAEPEQELASYPWPPQVSWDDGPEPDPEPYPNPWPEAKPGPDLRPYLLPAPESAGTGIAWPDAPDTVPPQARVPEAG